MTLVKATPVLTSRLEESMCVAAMTLDEDPRWIRLHPVPFRDLDEDSQFSKYQEITLRAIRQHDRRPESWTPVEGSITLGQTIGTEHAWSTRRNRVDGLGENTMCELWERNHSGSGPGTPSLSVVRTTEPPELTITERDPKQLRKWTELAEAISSQPSLFDDTTKKKPKIDVVPWRFRYKYRCLASNCNGHDQTIVDWEAVALWRNVRYDSDWQDKMRQKFVSQLWASDRDTVLFVGNQEQHPQSFLVLGVFWPPDQPIQSSLLG